MVTPKMTFMLEVSLPLVDTLMYASWNRQAQQYAEKISLRYEKFDWR